MNDLYGTSANAISQGNMRTQSVRDLNNSIKQHNSDVSDKIAGLRDQEATTNVINQIQNTGKELWAGKGMPDKIAAYKAWRANPTASNPSLQSAKSLISDAAKNNPIASAMEDAKGKVTSIGETIAEGSPSGATVAENTASVAEGAASKLAKGMPGVADMTEDGLSKLGKYAGAAGGLAQGTMDLVNDFKGGTFHLAGDNTEAKIGGALNLAGSVADVIGVGFPPAALVGGALDLASGAMNEIGDLISGNKQSADLKAKQASETVAPVAEQAQQTITTGRTQ